MNKLFFLFGILTIIQLIMGWICGPHSCEWGNKVYFIIGIILLIASFLLPFQQHGWVSGQKIGFGFLLLLLSASIWVAGFFMFGFRIMCRMF